MDRRTLDTQILTQIHATSIMNTSENQVKLEVVTPQTYTLHNNELRTLAWISVMIMDLTILHAWLFFPGWALRGSDSFRSSTGMSSPIPLRCPWQASWYKWGWNKKATRPGYGQYVHFAGYKFVNKHIEIWMRQHEQSYEILLSYTLKSHSFQLTRNFL